MQHNSQNPVCSTLHRVISFLKGVNKECMHAVLLILCIGHLCTHYLFYSVGFCKLFSHHSKEKFFLCLSLHAYHRSFHWLEYVYDNSVACYVYRVSFFCSRRRNKGVSIQPLSQSYGIGLLHGCWVSRDLLLGVLLWLIFGSHDLCGHPWAGQRLKKFLPASKINIFIKEMRECARIH